MSVFSETVQEQTLLRKSWSISHFMTSDEPLLLNNASSSYYVDFPVSDRISPVSLDLDLQFYNSNKLIANRSQLVIFINNYYVKQVSLSPSEPVQKLKLSIAPEYLLNGYNRLTFQVAQHYIDDQCEDWAAPELWTRVDTEKTRLTLYARPKNISPRLSKLNELINDRLGKYAINFLRMEQEISDSYLYWGALAAQGIKLRLNYVPMVLKEQPITPYQWPAGGNDKKFNINPGQLKQDAILFATKQQLQTIVAPEILKQISGPYLGVFQQDANPENFILVISGLNEQQVSKAVKAFVLMRSLLPDSQYTVVKEIKWPANKKILPIGMVSEGENYHFSQFGYRTQEMDATHDKISINIMMPADLYSTEDAMVTLNLNLAYGAAIRKDSVVNFALNGLFNHAIRLKEMEGAHYKNYQIAVPLRDFKPGLNTLTFKAVMNPSEYGKCSYVQHENLKLTLYQDSVISFPEAGRSASLPDLKLFEQTGFPFIQKGYAKETAIQLLDNSSDTIQTAWHTLAKMAMITKTPVFDFFISQNPSKKEYKNHIFIGHQNNIDEFLNNAPISLKQWRQFPYPFQESHQEAEESWLHWVERVVFKDALLPPATKQKLENVEIVQSGGLGEQFLMMSYPSNRADEGVDLVMLAEKNHSLYSGFITLLNSGMWSQIADNIFIWNNEKQFYSLREGQSFVMGGGDSGLDLIKHFSMHPWQWTLIVVVLLLLITLVIHWLLKQYKQTVHPDVEESVD